MTNVLVFESDPEFAQSLVSGLASYGCTTDVVDDGETGIERAEKRKPDLILLSIELPRMNGFSVCNKLKRSAALKDIPLILLSSEATEETFEQHKRLKTRAEGYLHKPIGISALVDTIRPLVPLTGGGSGEDDIEEIAILDDEIEAEVDDETDEVFGNLIAKAPEPKAAAEVVAAPLELDESDGLAVASEPPHASEPERFVPPSQSPGPRVTDAELEQLRRERKESLEQVAGLERDLADTRLALTRAEEMKVQLEKRKDDELALFRKEVEALKEKVASNQGGTAREFLDLREQLNKKDKEIIDVRDQLTSREREVVKLNETNIALERERADLKDRQRELETDKSALEKLRDALSDDKAQANKRADDFRAKSERLAEELESRTTELRGAREAHELELASRDAATAALKEDQKRELREADEKAALAQTKAVEEAVALADERGQAAKEAALVEAAERAKAEQAAAISQREAELKTEHDAKMAALHRANEEALRKLKAEHQQKSEEAAQKAADELAARERSLTDQKEAELKDLTERKDAEFQAFKAEKEGQMADRDARIASLESTLSARTEERDERQRQILDREARIAQLEAELASVRADLSSTQGNLQDELQKLNQARDKWSKDREALGRARQALLAAQGELDAAEARPIS